MSCSRFAALLWSLVFAVCALCAPSTHATTVQVYVTGTVTGIDNHSLPGFSNPTFSNLALGDLITGHWSYDTTTPFGLIPISGTHFGYALDNFGLMSFSTGGRTGGFANFSNAGSALFDLPGSGRVFPEESYSVSLQFEPNYFDAIPPSALDMSAFLFGSIFGTYTAFPGNFISYMANVTSVASVVPLPSAVWLFVSALLGFFGMCRSRFWLGSRSVA
jgi:hypothetical protein